MAEFESYFLDKALLALKILGGIFVVRGITLVMGDTHYLPFIDEFMSMILHVAQTIASFFSNFSKGMFNF